MWNPFRKSEQLGAPTPRPISPPSSEKPRVRKPITRKEVEQALSDPFAVAMTRNQRCRTVGATADGKLLLVVQTWDETGQSDGRIIGVRNAGIRERRVYEIGEF